MTGVAVKLARSMTQLAIAIGGPGGPDGPRSPRWLISEIRSRSSSSPVRQDLLDEVVWTEIIATARSSAICACFALFAFAELTLDRRHLLAQQDFALTLVERRLGLAARSSCQSREHLDAVREHARNFLHPRARRNRCTQPPPRARLAMAIQKFLSS